jgi:hypothetical protein
MTDIAPDGDDLLDQEPEFDEGELLERFASWDRNIDAHWNDWRKEARKLYNFYACRQWDEDELIALEAEQRAAVTIDRFTAVIDAVAGAEITDRQQVRYFPREIGDSQVNEMLTGGAEWIRDRSDADQEESEAFKDVLICGLACTETRIDYDDDPDGQILVERIDPLDCLPDPSARRANASDARYLRRMHVLSKDEFKERFPGFDPMGSDATNSTPTSSDRRFRYESSDDTGDAPLQEEEVEVREYQWFEMERFGRMATPAGEIEVTGAQLEALKDNPWLVELRRRRYYRAYVNGGQLLQRQELLKRAPRNADKAPIGEFTIKFITGKRDRNKGVWFGLGRLMKDPQKWANSFFGNILHIIRTNAKGGNIIEEGVVADKDRFEQDWAKADANVYVKAGGLEKIKPKPQAEYPQGSDRLMQVAITGIRDATGVNEEMLGMVERQQAGILEHQRKQAAYGILTSFFDGKRRYHRAQGVLMAKFMTEYLPEGYLVRITGADGGEKYEALARLPDTMKFDVVVDDAPAGPNQKERTFAMVEKLFPMLEKVELGPPEWAEIMKYLPLPQALTQKIAQALSAKAQQGPDPMQTAAAQAGVAKTTAEARAKNADAAKTEQETQERGMFAGLTRLFSRQ